MDSSTKPHPGAIPLLHDLQADLAKMKARRLPMVVLFSRSDCTYCEEVRNNYLRPLDHDDHQILIREVVSDYVNDKIGTLPETTHAGFARRFDVRFFPTVFFFNYQLERLAPSLAGSGKAGFYGGYLDDRILQAKNKAMR